MVITDIGRKGLLSLLFAASFCIPIAVGAKFFFEQDRTVQSEEVDSIFPNRLQLHGNNAYISIASAPELNPQPDKDFLVSGWFKLGQLPTEDEEVVLFSKIDQGDRFKAGYLLSLVKRGSSIRPSLYWKNSEGKGGTYEFSNFRMLPRVWNCFVLTLHDNVLIGLHRIEQAEGKKPVRELLGGFRLSTPVFPSTTAPFIVGSESGKQIKGSVGPVAIVSGQKILDDVDERLKSISKFPQDIFEIFKNKEVVFFTADGATDQSDAHREIKKSAMVERVIRLEKKLEKKRRVDDKE